MPNKTEIAPFSLPDQLLEQEPSENTRQVLGRTALDGIAISAGHFHGGEHRVVKTPDEYAVIIRSPGGSREKDILAGSGDDCDSAILATWEGMRSLETIQTKALAHIEMTRSGAFVDYTKLADYAPKMAPGTEVYPVPDYLKDSITEGIHGNDTYRNTIEREGWQDELRSLIEAYIDTAEGKRLAEGLGIRSLSHLTPEQAVKLSAAFVQNVSKYENDDKGKPAGGRADGMTTIELLYEGMDKKNDLSWNGNGVCRNVASNVKAVFESLKETQAAEASMLRNTYCAYAGGYSESYESRRSKGADDKSQATWRSTSGADGIPHAWNRFVTVDKDGSAVISIVDVTWGLSEFILNPRDESVVGHTDYTEVRSAFEIANMFGGSDSKTEAFDSLTQYINKALIYGVMHPRLGKQRSEDFQRHMTTEYLKAAAVMLESGDNLSEYYSLPSTIVAGASHLRDEMNKKELETLFTLDTASGGMERERIGRIIATYYIKDRRLPKQFIFKDGDLQQLVFGAVDGAQLRELAEHDGHFRARLREYRPDLLPPFDPSVQEDVRELIYLAASNGITNSTNPERIMKEFRRRLINVAGSEAVFGAVTAGRTDYDLAKNFRSITQSLRDQKQA